MQASNPYIGPAAFTENESNRFFGRTEETRELASRVIARKAVLLYAQSGAGKTSLLQASLIPELRQRKRGETFPIARVTGSVETARNIYIENALAKLLPDSPGPMAGMTFSKAFGTVLTNDPSSRRLTRLVIFDQFEEIFTLRPELTDQRREFFEQLGDCLATHPQLSLLLSMREDYLADLEQYSALLPDRLRARMRLERLGELSALDAIREPAAQAGLPFAAGTAEELVNNLRRIRTGNGFALGEYVEPVQLQIVCRQLWSRLMEEVLSRKSEIDAEDIRAHANVDGALSQFYRDSIARARHAGVTERALRRWFGERLITPAGTRGLVYRGATTTEGLPNAAADILRDCYIVRSELRGGNVWHELAHDRLVEPIQQDNSEWEKNYRNPVAEARKRGEDNLLTARGLTEALQFANDNPNELTPEERAFLKRSVEAEKQNRARRRNMIVAVLVMIILPMYFAWSEHLEHLKEHKAEEIANAKAKVAEEAKKDAQQQASVALQAKTAALTQEKLAKTAQKEAYESADVAKQESQKATAAELAAQAQAEASSDVGAPHSVLLALESILRKPAESTVPTASLQPLARVLEAVDGIPLQHAGRVSKVIFSPNDRWLGTASGAEVRLWNMETPSDMPIILHHGKTVNALAFSPDSRRLATVGDDATLRLWDVPLPEPAHAGLVATQQSAILDVAFSADGRWLATGSKDGTVQLRTLRVADPKAAMAILHVKGPVSSLAFSNSRDNRWLAIGSGDQEGEGDSHKGQQVTLWDLRSPNATGILFKLPEDRADSTLNVRKITFSPDGQWLVVAGTGNLHMALLRVDTPGDTKVLDNPQWQQTAAFSLDRHWLATTYDSGAKVWNMNDADPSKQPVVLRGHKGGVNDLAFSDDGQWLATAGTDRTVQLWNVTRNFVGAPVVLRGHEGPINTLAFSHDSRFLATASDDRTVRLWLSLCAPQAEPLALCRPSGAGLTLWDIKGAEPRLAPHVLGTEMLPPESSSVFSPGKKTTWLATYSNRDSIHLWNLSTSTPADYKLPSSAAVWASPVFSPDGRWLATLGMQVELWDLNKPASNSHPLTTSSLYGPRSLAFSADGHRLVIGARDGRVFVVDFVVDGQSVPVNLRKTLTGGGDIKAVAISPDGRYVVAGSWEPDPNNLQESSHSCCAARIWDLSSSAVLPIWPELKFDNGRVSDVAISPNGRWVAAGSWDKTTQLLDLNRPKAGPFVLKEHTQRTLSVAFSPDSLWLATGNEDQTARLWNLSAVDPSVGSIALQAPYAVGNVAFSADGRWLALNPAESRSNPFSPDGKWFASSDPVTLIYHVGPSLNYLVSLACRIAGRNLTGPGEWGKLFGSQPYRKTCPELP